MGKNWTGLIFLNGKITNRCNINSLIPINDDCMRWLIDLTSLYFCSSSLSVQKMKQLKLNTSEAKLKVLQHLTRIEIDKKGFVRLLM